MDLIDDEGNVLGLVNVIDALVVLVLLAIVAGGVAITLGDGSDPQSEPDLDTTHVTLDLGVQPSYVASELNEGDTHSPDGHSQLTVTDVYLSPAKNGKHVTLRAELEGVAEEETIDYNGAPPRLGRELVIDTHRYRVNGSITDVSTGETLETGTRELLLRTTTDTDTASQIAEGDTYQIHGRTLATVESVTVYGNESADLKDVYVGLTVETPNTDADSHYANTSIREGATLPFETETYAVRGEVQRTGATEERGDPAVRTVTLRMTDVPPERANAITAGTSEEANDDTVAEIIDVRTEPSTVVLTTEDGEIVERDHPRNVDVTITAELAVRETDTGVRFKGDRLRTGSTVSLDLDTVTVNATVRSYQ